MTKNLISQREAFLYWKFLEQVHSSYWLHPFSFWHSKVGGKVKRKLFIIHNASDQNSPSISLPTIFVFSDIFIYNESFLGAGVPHLVQQGCGALAGHCIVQSHAKNYKGKQSLSQYSPNTPYRKLNKYKGIMSCRDVVKVSKTTFILLSEIRNSF